MSVDEAGVDRLYDSVLAPKIAEPRDDCDVQP